MPGDAGRWRSGGWLLDQSYHQSFDRGPGSLLKTPVICCCHHSYAVSVGVTPAARENLNSGLGKATGIRSNSSRSKVILMQARKCFVPLIGFSMLAIVSGCSGKGSGGLATVSGVITQNGTPLADAKVTFISTVESAGKRDAFSAVTDSSGKYLIATVGKEPGIPPGMYKVTITKFEAAKSGSAAEIDPGQVAASGTGKNAVSQEYENEFTTKLSVTLEAGKNEGKNFDVKPNAASGGGKQTGGIPIP